MFLLSTSLFAQSLTYQYWSNRVISQEDRVSKTSDWKEILEGRIEIIKENKVKERNQSFANAISNHLNLEQLETLQMGNLYISTHDISYNENFITFPFVMSIRYKEDIFSQGTNNVRGAIQVEIEGTEIKSFELLYYSDSWWFEEFGRFVGFLDSYGEDFLENICSPFLFELFKDKKYIDKLEKAFKHKQISDSLLRKTYVF